jgi:hypothetical protein
MAVSIEVAQTEQPAADWSLTRSCLILLAWTGAGWAMTAWVVGRRK